MKRLSLIMVVICAHAALADVPTQTRDERFTATDSTTVNYVKLVGWGGDKDQNRRRIQETYEGCARVLKGTGRHVEPLPPGGIPELVNPMNWEIYYGVDRVLVVDTGAIHYIDMSNCKLIESRRNNLQFRGSRGGCEVKLPVDGSSGGVASGACSEFTDQAAMAPRAKVKPENSNAHVHFADPFRGIPGWIEPNHPFLAQTGERRGYAGLDCVTFESTILPYKMCLAFPNVQGQPPKPRVEADGRLHGVLLSVDTGVMHLKAVEVKLGLMASHKLFMVPPGVTIRSLGP